MDQRMGQTVERLGFVPYPREQTSAALRTVAVCTPVWVLDCMYACVGAGLFLNPTSYLCYTETKHAHVLTGVGRRGGGAPALLCLAQRRHLRAARRTQRYMIISCISGVSLRLSHTTKV